MKPLFVGFLFPWISATGFITQEYASWGLTGLLGKGCVTEPEE